MAFVSILALANFVIQLEYLKILSLHITFIAGRP